MISVKRQVRTQQEAYSLVTSEIAGGHLNPPVPPPFDRTEHKSEPKEQTCPSLSLKNWGTLSLDLFLHANIKIIHTTVINVIT